jgi:hypothetical protein
MLSIVVSTLAYFIAAYFIRRYLDDMGMDKTAGRALIVFVLALGIAYGVAAVVDWAAGLFA